VKQLKEKDLITSACEEMLERIFSDVPVALFKRMASNAGKGCKYSPELKAFALTLQFYSTKAYNFVRKTFNLASCLIQFKLESGTPKYQLNQGLQNQHLRHLN
jgi:hypothetical protein